MSETAAGFLNERRDFLYVYASESASGDGWDVVVRIDGTYPDRSDAEGAAESIRQRVDRLADVSTAGRIWWQGPPWKRSA